MTEQQFPTELELQLDVQIAVEKENDLPTEEQLNQWAVAALLKRTEHEEPELTIRIVDEAESQELNHEYRGKDKPTNVLCFPFEAPAHVPIPLLGDLIVCKQVVEREAIEQDKSEVVIGKGISYWAPTIARLFPNTFRKVTAKKNFRD